MTKDFVVKPGEELERVLDRAYAYLEQAAVVSARVDADLLAAHCWQVCTGEKVNRGRILSLALAGYIVSTELASLLGEALSQRARRIPLQHITGTASFRSLDLRVGPGVFIPRPETELLVTHLLEQIDARTENDRPVKIADLCTGSGAIAASVSTERPGTEVVAVELSAAAFDWAYKNCAELGVRLVLDDAAYALAGEESSFDLVAANPPYIPLEAIPQEPEVRDHDPALALYGGSRDGMKVPRAMVKRAYDLLKPGGYFICEHDESQRDPMRDTFATRGFEAIRSIGDLTGRPRYTSGIKPGSDSPTSHTHLIRNL